MRTCGLGVCLHHSLDGAIRLFHLPRDGAGAVVEHPGLVGRAGRPQPSQTAADVKKFNAQLRDSKQYASKNVAQKKKGKRYVKPATEEGVVADDKRVWKEGFLSHMKENMG